MYLFLHRPQLILIIFFIHWCFGMMPQNAREKCIFINNEKKTLSTLNRRVVSRKYLIIDFIF